MKNYFTKLVDKFLKSSLKTKIICFFGFLFYTLLLVFTLVKVNYEVITPAGLNHITSYITIESEEKVGHVYTVSVYSSKRISLLQKFLASKNYQVDLYHYDPAKILSDKDEVKQGTVMKDVSIINSLIVSYTEAKKTNSNITFDYTFNGMIIHTTTKYTPKDLQIGDVIVKINDIDVTLENFTEILTNIDKEDTCVTNPTPIKLTINRKGITKEITVHKTFNDNACKIGITSYPLFQLSEEITPSYKIRNVNTIGPSGGLMQALGIYNTLVDEDVTKGLILAGTGTIDALGNVGAIGGVRQKVMSAYYANVDVFFVPEANYKDAKEIYDRLKNPSFELKMVKTFNEALEYLDSKEAK